MEDLISAGSYIVDECEIDLTRILSIEAEAGSTKNDDDYYYDDEHDDDDGAAGGHGVDNHLNVRVLVFVYQLS